LFDKIFTGYCTNDHAIDRAFRSTSIVVYGHDVHIPMLAVGRRCAKFSFHDLCGKPYGAVDYIALGNMFNVIAISDVPSMTLSNRNEVCGIDGFIKRN
jgi:predicted ATPase